MTNVINGPLQCIGSDATSIDTSILEALQYQLHRNLDQILNHFAQYVSYICEAVVQKGINVRTLLTYLLNLPALKYHSDKEQHKLLHGKREKLKKSNTIYDIFDLIGEECASFLNYGIFQSIAKNYGIVEDCDKLKYPQHLQLYLQSHKVSEFVRINPLLEKRWDPSKKEVTFNFDIELIERVAGVYDLKPRIADILGLDVLAVELVDIKDGCVIITFLIPANVADAIFQVFKSPQKLKVTRMKFEFRALKVTWMKFDGNYVFDFRQESNPDFRQEDAKKMESDDKCISGKYNVIITLSTFDLV